MDTELEKLEYQMFQAHLRLTKYSETMRGGRQLFHLPQSHACGERGCLQRLL